MLRWRATLRPRTICRVSYQLDHWIYCMQSGSVPLGGCWWLVIGWTWVSSFWEDRNCTVCIRWNFATGLSSSLQAGVVGWNCCCETAIGLDLLNSWGHRQDSIKWPELATCSFGSKNGSGTWLCRVKIKNSYPWIHIGPLIFLYLYTGIICVLWKIKHCFFDVNLLA